MLQILDDGRLTDSQGRTVDFKNTLIIMTSNIGSPHLLDNAGEGEIDPNTRAKVMKELRSHFRPEFLNRIDEIVLFKPLTPKEITRIVDLLVHSIQARLADRKITLKLTDDAKAYIAEHGYDPVYGARPLKRFLQKEIETGLSRQILAGTIEDGSTVTVTVHQGRLAFASKKTT
jgi:ATP-dependent Clp protease ATP-binding subunit ClpB